MEFHKIQKKILTKLITSDGARFTDLRPNELENDQYNYHLKQLISKGIVCRRNSKYFLTTEGKHIIEEEFPINPRGVIANRFKVASLTLLFDKKNKKILYQKRLRQPDYGEVMIPGGPLFKGEMPEECASRKLKEETGLVAKSENFNTIGILRKITKDKSGEIVSDIFYHICYCEKYSGDLKNTEFGENFWIDVDKAIDYEQKADVIKGLYKQHFSEMQKSKFFYSTILS